MSQIPVALLIIALSFHGPGCAPDNAIDSSDAADIDVLYFEPIGTGQRGTVQDTLETVIRDSVEWSSMVAMLNNREPFGPVDFSQSMVFLVALPQSTGGYRLQFESIEKQQDEITASYVVYAPGSDCLTISALTQPFLAVAARKAEGSVTFKRSVRWESCGVE